MMLRVYAVYDKAVSLFMPPIFMRAEAEAVRALRLTLNGDHSFSQSPSDYALYDLGTFDDASGVFANPDGTPPRKVCELASLMPKQEA